MDILDKVRALILRLTGNTGMDPSEIDASDMLTSLGVDSLGLVELVVELEGELGILFDDAELDPNRLLCVQDVADIARRHIGEV